MKLTTVSILTVLLMIFKEFFGLVAFPTLGTMYATSVSSLYFAVDNLLNMINELPVKVNTWDPLDIVFYWGFSITSYSSLLITWLQPHYTTLLITMMLALWMEISLLGLACSPFMCFMLTNTGRRYYTVVAVSCKPWGEGYIKCASSIHPPFCIQPVH